MSYYVFDQCRTIRKCRTMSSPTVVPLPRTIVCIYRSTAILNLAKFYMYKSNASCKSRSLHISCLAPAICAPVPVKDFSSSKCITRAVQLSVTLLAKGFWLKGTHWSFKRMSAERILRRQFEPFCFQGNFCHATTMWQCRAHG